MRQIQLVVHPYLWHPFEKRSQQQLWAKVPSSRKRPRRKRWASNVQAGRVTGSQRVLSKIWDVFFIWCSVLPSGFEPIFETSLNLESFEGAKDCYHFHQVGQKTQVSGLDSGLDSSELNETFVIIIWRSNFVINFGLNLTIIIWQSKCTTSSRFFHRPPAVFAFSLVQRTMKRVTTAKPFLKKRGQWKPKSNTELYCIVTYCTVLYFIVLDHFEALII